MPRKAARKAKPKGGGREPPPPPNAPGKASDAVYSVIGASSRAEKALAERVRTLEWDLHDLTASVQLRDHERHQRQSQEFQKIYARIAAISDQIADLENREERLTAAIEQATKAAKVLERVELGLRPMLLKALEAEGDKQPVASGAPAIPRAAEPVDHIERYYKHLAYQSSLRS